MIVKKKEKKKRENLATSEANTFQQGTYVPKPLCHHPEQIEIT